VETTEKVLDVPAIDMTDGGGQGKPSPPAHPTNQPGESTTGAATGPKNRGRPKGSKNRAKTSLAQNPARTSKRAVQGNGAQPETVAEVDRLAEELVRSVEALAALVRDQDAALADVRRRVDGMRELLG
jgi:hypothetical protein